MATIQERGYGMHISFDCTKTFLFTFNTGKKLGERSLNLESGSGRNLKEIAFLNN